MATVSKSYTATGSSESLLLKHLERLTYSISGTYSATTHIQRSVTGGQSWETLVSNSTDNATVTGEILNEVPGGGTALFRTNCSLRTSGTCVTSISDVTTEVIVGSEIKNKNGVTVFSANENGVVITGNLDISGTVSTGGSGGEDYTVSVTDDISLTAADDFLIDAGGALTITSDETLGLTVTDAGADLNMTAADAVTITATGGDASLVATAGTAALTATAGAATVTAGTNTTITATAGNATVAATAGDVFVTAGDDIEVTSTGYLQLTGGTNIDVITSGALGETCVNYTLIDTGDTIIRNNKNGGTISIEALGTTGFISLGPTGAAGDVHISGGLKLKRNLHTVSDSTASEVIAARTNAAHTTLTLEADTNKSGRVIIVADEVGGAFASPLTITPESGTIDGVASAVISENYGSLALYGNATNWFTLWDNPGYLSQKSNATLIGAVAAPAAGTTAVKIQRLGPFFVLTFTLTAAQITVTDGGAAGAYGATKIFDFVEGGLSFLGCRQNYTAYTPDGTGVPDDDVFVIGIGTTPISAAADATLAAGEQNVGASISQTLVAGTTTGTGFTAANSAFDGTGTAADLYLNYSGDDVTTDANGTLGVTGTITVVGTFLGDD